MLFHIFFFSNLKLYISVLNFMLPKKREENNNVAMHIVYCNQVLYRNSGLRTHFSDI